MNVENVPKELADSLYIGVRADNGTFTFISIASLLSENETLIRITESEGEE